MSTSSIEEKEYYSLTRRAFDSLAPFYNLMTLPLIKVRDRVADLAGAGKKLAILDVATGTGQQALAFARHGHKVIGVDLTESMLAIARKHDPKGLVQFEAGDATRLQYEENRFDVTCISFALHDMPPAIREKVVGEMIRVTKPGGLILVVDYSLPHNKLGRSLIYRFVSLYEAEYYREFIASDLEGLIRRMGIVIIEEYPVLLGAGRIIRGTVS